MDSNFTFAFVQGFKQRRLSAEIPDVIFAVWFAYLFQKLICSVLKLFWLFDTYYKEHFLIYSGLVWSGLVWSGLVYSAEVLCKMAKRLSAPENNWVCCEIVSPGNVRSYTHEDSQPIWLPNMSSTMTIMDMPTWTEKAHKASTLDKELSVTKKCWEEK